MKRVLVTGGAGYLGSVLCEHLLGRGYRVSVVDNLLFGQKSLLHLVSNPSFTFHYGDVRDEQLIGRLLKDADAIIPLAAIVGAPACDRDPWAAQSVNCDAISLLNRLRSPQQLIVYPNTNSGYGTKSGELYCTEESPLEPISLYGRLKVQAEQALLQTPNTIALRLATVFGASPRMRIDLLVNSFVHAAVTDGYLMIFEASFKRNFIHIRDVADCFCFALENSETMAGRPYNVGLDAANLSKGELGELIRRHLPDFQVAHAELATDPDKRNYIVSNERLRAAGFEAKRSLDDGVTELVKAYQLLGRREMRNV